MALRNGKIDSTVHSNLLTSTEAEPQKHEALKGNGRLRALFRNGGLKAVAVTKDAIVGEEEETPKVIVTKDLWTAVFRCAVHLLPLSVTVVLAYLNLASYYIGGELQGLSGPLFNALDNFCLQVAAKLAELAVMGSIGTIVMDVLRNELLYGKDGLPLGMLSGKSRYSELSYFWSPEFWYGRKGFSSKRRNWLIPAVLFVAGLFAVLTGPAAALLLIPTMREEWPAGSANFWLNGTDQTLWPATLDASAVGGPECLLPSVETVMSTVQNSSACIWGGHEYLAQYYRQWRFRGLLSNVTMDEGQFRRDLRCGLRGNSSRETWTLGSSLAVGAFAQKIHIAWGDALALAPKTQPGKMYATFSARPQAGTVSTVESRVPAVRTQCNWYPIKFGSDEQTLGYPWLPEYDYSSYSADAFNIDLMGYALSEVYPPSSNISSRWLPGPATPALLKYAGNGTVNHTHFLPSAFLGIQIPALDPSPASGTVFACSIDARWAPGKNIATDGAPFSRFTQHSEITNVREPQEIHPASRDGFLPINDGSWTTVRIDPAWLNTLTPPLSTTNPNFTTLSAFLESIDARNATGWMKSYNDIVTGVEGILATLVADAMSRVGYRANSAPEAMRWNGDVFASSTPYNNILPDSTTDAFLPPPDTPLASLTPLTWSVTIAGYAYGADSLAYYLALAVLFSHAALALAHVAYRIYTRRSAECWDSWEELLVLAWMSKPPLEREGMPLRNTCAGIGSARTMRTRMRVRVADEKGGGEGVEMVVAGEEGEEWGEGKVEENVRYGAI